MSLSEQSPVPSSPQPHRQEAAACHTARMPAWKREILERRKAKLASPAADSRSWIPSRPAAHSNRTGEAERDREPGRGPAATAGVEAGSEAAPGSAVLLESIAPLQENPFIKRERRRRLAERQASGGGGFPSAKPVQQLLELYSHMPGVRTIQADNIIIIESDPDYFPEAGPPRLSTVSELLSRAGQGSVAEIRAAEVLVYQGPLSRSEENLSTLGAEEARPAELHGKVSRLLEKFDQKYVKPTRSRSTENLLDGFSPSKDRHRKPLVLPKPPSVSKQSHGAATQEGQSRAGVSPSPEGLRSPGPHLDKVSPSQSKSFPLSSPTKYSAPLSPSHTPSVPTVALHDQENAKLSVSDKTVSEDRHFSVSSYRKQFESVPANGWQLRQKESPPRKTPSHRNNENILKDWTTKENKLMVNGHPDLDLVETDSFSVNEGEVQSEDQMDANGIGSGQVPYSISSSSSEVSIGTSTWRSEYEGNQRKASKSSPETPQPATAGGSRQSSAKPSATPSGKVNQNHKVESSAKVTPNQCNGVSASTSLNNSFEIVPAKLPDFSSIPEDDIQARALANLKKQSRNSFVVIPKKRAGACVASSEVCDNRDMNKTCEKPKIENSASISEVQTSRISAVSLARINPSDKQNKEGKLLVREPLLPKADFKPKDEDTLNKSTSSGSYDVYSEHMNNQLSAGKETTSVLPTAMSETEWNAESTVIIKKVTPRIEEDLPVTNIDDILVTEEKETSKQPTRAKSAVAKDKPAEESFGGSQHSFVQRKSGNTFTIVPQRKPASKELQPSVNTNEISQGNGTDEQSVEDPEPSLAKLGVLLKKRYPLAEEIQVIGGYLSLERSCLSKADSTRKKMKISFNDSSLHTTFEYPSENALIQEVESEESDNNEEEQSSTFFFPRPSYTSSPTSPSSPLRTNTRVSAFTNYTPKHTMSLNTWQEQKLDGSVSGRDSSLQDTESTTEDDMLTPADSSSHSDYSSEPALYF
ncbi:taperin [Carcharodon carcharias]|uniref:taperin n=1 Tax=Carcharodon carcharias TaxID=13397 RepID=UPI001B7E493C|nr:taperin [Carcharodon carcharias]